MNAETPVTVDIKPMPETLIAWTYAAYITRG